MPKATILIPTFNRDELLRFGLISIIRQQVDDIEIFVLNDGPHSEATQRLAQSFGAKYIHTGVRFNDGGEGSWRIPGFAFNIGAKMAASDVLILTCPEMWHMEVYTLDRLIEPVAEDPKNMGRPKGRRDNHAKFLTALRKSPAAASRALFSRLAALRTSLPFLLSVSKQSYCEIGGYDEDFLGRSFDDDDFVGRMVAAGNQYVQVEASCVHLHHPKMPMVMTVPITHNKELYNIRKGQIIRNAGREWGVLR